jgi:hypothetical protein
MKVGATWKSAAAEEPVAGAAVAGDNPTAESYTPAERTPKEGASQNTESTSKAKPTTH